MKEKELNARQLNLYRLLMEETLMGGFLRVEDICSKMPEDYHVDIEEKHRTNCPLLYRDIDELNLSTRTHHLIIKGNNHIRIATRSDYEEMEETYTKQVSRLMKLRYRLRKKLSNNNQIRWLTEDIVPISESRAKEYIKAYEREK